MRKFVNMKRILLLAVSILVLSCSTDENNINQYQTPVEVFENKVYNNLVYINGTFERLNSNGDQLPVSITDAVTIFEKTTSIKITSETFETNTITPIAYFKNGSTYGLPLNTQFSIYEDLRIIVKKIEYNTSYGKDKRSERYSY